MDELKPCPFCGSSGAILDEPLNEDEYGCFCNALCGAIGPCDEDGEKAVEFWNTRPIEDALNARIAELEAHIAELEAERRWIPVGERLPEERQNVLALDKTGTAYHWEYSKSLSNIFVGDYTHWMPLPEPPEREVCVILGRKLVDEWRDEE